MAGNIQKVNLSNLYNEIHLYDVEVCKLYSDFRSMYTSLKSLPNYWTGKRINTVLEVWNNNCVKLVEEVNYFYNKIYYIMRDIHKQYTAMEQSAPKDFNTHIEITSITKIGLTDASTIKYDKAKVESIYRTIFDNNMRIVTTLPKLVNMLDSMNGYSDSLKSLATNYKNNATNLQKTIDTLSKTIKNETFKAVRDVSVTEQYNEKDAKRAATTTK